MFNCKNEVFLLPMAAVDIYSGGCNHGHLRIRDGAGVILVSSLIRFLVFWGKFYKTFHVRNLLVFIMSYSVSPWQAFPA
jgi:hypothetical protein